MDKESPNYAIWKEKMRLCNIKSADNRKGKTLEEIYGIDKANQIKEKMKQPKGSKEYNEMIKDRCYKVNKFRKGKTYEEIYGIEKAREVRLKMKGKQAWNKGKKGCFSEETIKKMIKSRTGWRYPIDKYPNHGMRGKTMSPESRRRLSEAHSGEKHHMYGKKHSEESKRKMSETTKGMPIWNKGKKYTPEQYARIYNEERLKQQSKRMSGDKHFAWQGGISFEPYSLEFNDKFKEAIRERDNRCCVICNKSEEELGQKLSIHHVDYIKQNSFPQNCVSLCRSHHTDTNYNRDHWKTFLQSLLKERYGYEYTQDQKIILDFTKNEKW